MTRLRSRETRHFRKWGAQAASRGSAATAAWMRSSSASSRGWSAMACSSSGTSRGSTLLRAKGNSSWKRFSWLSWMVSMWVITS